MIGAIAKLRVKPGMEAEFEKHAKTLIAKVLANEPGCYLYELFKSKEGDVYVFMEKYKDKAALIAHGQTDYFLESQSKIAPCLSEAPDLQFFNAV